MAWVWQMCHILWHVWCARQLYANARRVQWTVGPPWVRKWKTVNRKLLVAFNLAIMQHLAKRVANKFIPGKCTHIADVNVADDFYVEQSAQVLEFRTKYAIFSITIIYIMHASLQTTAASWGHWLVTGNVACKNAKKLCKNFKFCKNAAGKHWKNPEDSCEVLKTENYIWNQSNGQGMCPRFQF